VDALIRLAVVFGSLSLLGFGGGKGIIPQMSEAAVAQFHWVSSEQFTQFYTIGKLAPGPTTTFSALVGLQAGGYPGAVVAVAAMFLPSSLLMMLGEHLWRRASAWPMKEWLTIGLAPVIIGLVWSSVFSVGRGMMDGWVGIAIAAVAALLMLRTAAGGSLVIVAGAVGGMLLLR
jgi:chromate transporter